MFLIRFRSGLWAGQSRTFILRFLKIFEIDLAVGIGHYSVEKCSSHGLFHEWTDSIFDKLSISDNIHPALQFDHGPHSVPRETSPNHDRVAAHLQYGPGALDGLYLPHHASHIDSAAAVDSDKLALIGKQHIFPILN